MAAYSDEPGQDVLSIIETYSLPGEFNEKCLQQAEKAAKPVNVMNVAKRRDLRNTKMVTIDGDDAKDLDDAISLEKEGDNYALVVHIADVANYVQENSSLDREAKRRGTSVYLVDRVIPMLPAALSNGICSLNVDEERLSLSCMMRLSPEGEVLEYEIAETLIKIDRRLSYESVRAIIEDKNPATISEYRDLVPMFLLMEELAAILRKKRIKRGSIDFVFPECKILLDDKGYPAEVKASLPNSATRIIEEFMLLANETVATHFYHLHSPFIYRNHDDPSPAKIDMLFQNMGNFGFKMGGKRAAQARQAVVVAKKSGVLKKKAETEKRSASKAKAKVKSKREVEVRERIHPRELQKILNKAAGTPYEKTINIMALRSMKRAEYSTKKVGHFGLASPCYCHFTSPIRRYPDLQIHRIIKEHLRGRFNRDRQEHYEMILAEVAKLSSERERRAEEVEREVTKLKKTEYMERHLGEIFDGVVSGITSWGMYVELANTIEGLVHVSSISDDQYVYEEATMRLVGRKNGNSFRLGQAVKIWVKAADKWSRTIDFELV